MAVRDGVTRHDFALLVAAILLVAGANCHLFGADDSAAFEPAASIFVRRCVECHSGHETSGGLNLTTKSTALQGGDSGEAILPGKATDSYLLARIRDGEMPPPEKGIPRPLPADEAAVIEKWIAAGAAWPEQRVLDLYERTTDVRGGRDFWSLQPVVRPPVPQQAAVGAATNPIDAFIAAKLTEAGFEPAPPADRATLIRRMFFDVIGLPPTAEEIATFVHDDRPEAISDLVEHLLASPHFGERWARRWLDLARFAETSGYERDQEKPGAWRYRDWVVNAANSDMPYDQFVLQQLAGDEMPNANESTVIATGFLRLGTWNDEPNDAEEYKYDRLEDMVHATSTAFIAMTVKCARCHDHKFDPIPQVDYYKFAAAFSAGPIEARGRELLGGPSKEELGYDVLGWTDLSATPPDLHLLKKGDPKRPLDVITPGTPSMAASLTRDVPPPEEGAKTTHRRLELARWIVEPTNPLTARVFVNRIWQSHFGEGLVRSPDNFGFTGDRPTHPELLDWLADEFVKSGWSAKHIHRLILTSKTYQQSSLHPQAAKYAATDSGNRLWWRSERRRLDAEQLRDRMLAVSGSLDLTAGGPSFKATVGVDALEGLSMKGAAWTPSPPEQQNRRSLYMYTKRGLLPPLMTTFDFVDTTLPCGRRDVSTVAPQALALMNNAFVHEQSQRLAKAVAASAGSDLDEQVDAAWRLALGREPSSTEHRAGVEHVRDQAEHFEQLPPTPPPPPGRILEAGLVQHLRASEGVETDESGGVVRWRDLSGAEHDAAQSDPIRRPQRIADGMNGRPTLRFDGQRRFLESAGQVLTSQHFTVFAVVTDAGGTASHRTLFSNWSARDGNIFTAVFLGTTGDSAVRLTDDFAGVGQLQEPSKPFLLSGVSADQGAFLFQNLRELAHKSSPLSVRNLSTNYVIGQQGNIDGEYWRGDLAELVVYDRALTDDERTIVSRALSERYDLWHEPVSVPKTPQQLAMESLCHVLLNCNEFVYVD
jgi:hypothetical protein